MMRSALSEGLVATQPTRRNPQVRPFSDGDAARWDWFVDHAPEATFFHRAAWRGVIENVFHHRCHYLIAETNDDICGVLPLAEIRSALFGHSLISLPFCVYGGPVARDEDAETALINAAVELGSTLGVKHLELRNRRVMRSTWPRQNLYVTFRKRLESNVDDNLKAIPRKQRAMVRKGMNHRLRSEIDATAERFFDLYADNVHRHGTPALPKRYFERLISTFGDACEILTVVDSTGRPVSGVLSFYFRNEVLPYYAGDSLHARELAGNDFKYWELMRRACERGLQYFDYGRSKQGTGSFAFKKNWGFEPTPLAYEHQLYGRESIPQRNPLNPKYRAFIGLWRRLPRPLVNCVGPMIVRNLG